MTIKDWIEHLQKYPPNCEVVIEVETPLSDYRDDDDTSYWVPASYISLFDDNSTRVVMHLNKEIKVYPTFSDENEVL